MIEWSISEILKPDRAEQVGNTMKRTTPIGIGALWTFAFLAATLLTSYTIAREPTNEPDVVVLLPSNTTILGQQIQYPRTDQPRITAALITMLPGQSTGWHKHDVPVFAYILEGEITVDYGAQGTRDYRKGDSFLEAIYTAHNCYASGLQPAKRIAVFIGGQTISNTDPMSPPR